MRSPFNPPSEQDFLKLFAEPPPGGSLADIKYFKPSPRGTGIFGLLAGLAKKAAPFLVKKALPSGLNLIQNVADDVLAGKNFKSSLKQRGISAVKEVRDKIISGAGRRKRRSRRKRRNPSTTRKPKISQRRNAKKRKSVKRLRPNVFDDI